MKQRLKNKTFLFSMFLIIASTTSFASIKSEETHSFTMEAHDTLKIKVHDADIVIVGKTNTKQANIQILKEAKRMNEDEAAKAFEYHKIECNQKDDVVSIETIIENKKKNSSIFKKGYLNIKIRVEIPEEVKVLAKTSDGDLLLKQIKEDIELKTSDGDIEIVNVSGNVILSTSDGDIDAAQITGNANLRTSDGDIRLNKTSGEVNAQTSDGDLSLSEIDGPLNAQTSDGDINVNLISTPQKDCYLTTSDGDVELSVNEDVSANISVKISDGEIDVKHTKIQVSKMSRTLVEATLNNGGSNIKIRTSDGDVKITSN